MGYHDLTPDDRAKYEEHDKNYGGTNGHFRRVLDEGKWVSGDRGDGLKHCWYCGSLEPVEMLSLFEQNKVSQFSGSDWKYGYPHKFYVGVDTGKPSDTYYKIEDKEVNREEYLACISDHSDRRNTLSGTRDGTGVTHSKFYTNHLEDVEDAEVFKRLADELQRRFRIHFELSEGKVMYRAPYHGFQV